MSQVRVYWDANAFLGYLQDETVLDDAGRKRADSCEEVLNAHDAPTGELKIVTSAFTITEVLNTQGNKRIPRKPENRAQVVKLFEERKFTLLNVEEFLAWEAFNLVWDHNIDPKDAIHVASAIRMKVDEMHTYDAGLLRLNGVLPMDGAKKLKIRNPRVAQQDLPGVKDKP